MDTNGNLLDIRGLRTYFHSKEGTVRAVDGVSFSIDAGQTLGVAGESGCGKSVTAQSILRIVPSNGRIEGGSILFRRESGTVDLAAVDPRGEEIRAIRGGEISMIFQEPMTSFSPVYTIGNQIMEAIRLHQKVDAKEARVRAVEMLQRVGMPKPEKSVDSYPFNLSGGQRQRAMIAMALSCQPRLLIADEPTTAVDVTIQAQVLELMKELQAQFRTALMVITHDLAVIAELCDRVMIMYLGRSVECAPVEALFDRPRHPYTVGLLNSVPRLGDGAGQQIEAIEGTVPSLHRLPTGCPFHTRCPHHMPGTCDRSFPEPVEVSPGHTVHCHLYAEASR